MVTHQYVIMLRTGQTFNSLKCVAFGIAAFTRAIVQTYLHAGFRSLVTCEIIAIPCYERVSTRPAYQKIIPGRRTIVSSGYQHVVAGVAYEPVTSGITYQYVVMIRTYNTINSNQRIAFRMAAPGHALIQAYFHSGI